MKYPIGIQDFRELREGGYVYVDKTEHIHRILTQGKYYFLSRPRRFGKSLLVSTIKELYSGSRELFEGLWVEDHWNWEQNNPVIHIKFASFKYKNNPLKDAIQSGLQPEAKRLGVELRTGPFINPLEELIHQAYKKYQRKVALLIDEYDKPIIDHLDDIEQAEANRQALKNLYSILKDSDPYLELAFITGVSAFSKVSIFSDLNNLNNLSLHRGTATLLGITPEELEHYFSASLASLAEIEGTNQSAIYEKVKRWYNGYSWDGIHKVYNPFSLLSLLEGQQFRNFWFETGTPTFLVKEMKKQKYYNVKKLQVSQSKLSAFDFTRLDPISVLFQTGYLTIVHYDAEDGIFTLDYPNMEVRKSLEQNLLTEYLDYPLDDPLVKVVHLRNALRKKDLEGVVEILNAAFASIPYDFWQKENEHFFHALIHLVFSLLGTYIQSEVHTARGRCDALVQTEEYLYVFEFKLDKTAEEALKQIKEKGYLEPYADSPKEKIAVGVHFSSEEKKVVEWLVEAYV